MTYEEFERYVMKASARIAQAFETLDSEHAGCLTESGLLTALRQMGFHAKQVRTLATVHPARSCHRIYSA